MAYRIGIIGAGNIVESNHLPVLKNIKDIKVVWIYDQNRERSSMMRAMYGVGIIEESDLEKSLEEIDICLLATPYGTRKKFIELVASKGKALYVEKPFALTIQEHQYYQSLYAETKLAVGFQRRYYRIVTTLKSIIRSEIFGTLKRIKFTQGYFMLKGGSGYLSNASLAGGGVIAESGIHALDQLLVITEASAVRLINLKSLSKEGIDYDTIFSSEIETLKGRVIVDCEVSTLRNLENGLELHFENAVAKCNLSHEAVVLMVGKDGATFKLTDILASNNVGSITESFYVFWTKFIEAISTDKINLTVGNSSLITTSWIEQIYKDV
jgi:predicted dehydrogenase